MKNKPTHLFPTETKMHEPQSNQFSMLIYTDQPARASSHLRLAMWPFNMKIQRSSVELNFSGVRMRS